MSEAKLYRHPSLPVSAPEPYWTALRFTCYSNTDEVGNSHIGNYQEVAQAIMRGIEATGSNDHRALAWAMGELQRASEERTRATALAREAEGLQSLAKAIRESGEQQALERIIGRLTERTQYAVRKQLGS